MNNIQYIEIIKKCPYCNNDLIIENNNGTKILKCNNENCSQRLINRIEYYCSKSHGLNIKGLGKQTISLLCDWGWINSIFDIYTLRIYQKEWINKPGFGQASVLKILDAIDNSKKDVDLASFISAIGIPLVGKTIAKEIVKYYDTWEDFRNAVGGDWTEFNGFGPEISKAINNFDYNEADRCAAMLTFKIPEVQNNVPQAAAIKDKKIVITGSLLLIQNRQKLSNIVEEKGGKVTSSVSSLTDYLVCNDKNSSSTKMKKAKELNIPIISEEELLKMCNYKI